MNVVVATMGVWPESGMHDAGTLVSSTPHPVQHTVLHTGWGIMPLISIKNLMKTCWLGSSFSLLRWSVVHRQL